MFQVRVHGRGGQGVVTAAEILSVAGFIEGKHTQAFPSFGSERMGAPVMAFCRLDQQPIRLREPVSRPDLVMVQDDSLLLHPGVLAGQGSDAWLILNTHARREDLQALPGLQSFRADRILTLPATEIGREHTGRPLPNAAMLGACTVLAELPDEAAVLRALEQKFPGESGRRNAAAARAGRLTVQEYL